MVSESSGERMNCTTRVERDRLRRACRLREYGIWQHGIK